jgi:hypothetical protein
MSWVAAPLDGHAALLLPGAAAAVGRHVSQVVSVSQVHPNKSQVDQDYLIGVERHSMAHWYTDHTALQIALSRQHAIRSERVWQRARCGAVLPTFCPACRTIRGHAKLAASTLDQQQLLSLCITRQWRVEFKHKICFCVPCPVHVK